MKLPRFLKNLIPNFEIIDFKEWLKEGKIEIFLRKIDRDALMACRVCHGPLAQRRGHYRMKIKHLPLFNFECFIYLDRQKAYCPGCKKVRAEAIDFVSCETPHLSKEYSWWLGRLTEISTVSRVAELTGNDQNTLWRVDFDRMLKMVQNYKIPKVKRISVDEVHTRSKKRYSSEPRHKQYFTVVSDLDSGRVIWVSENREKAALDEFYALIGPERCKLIKVAAMDQFEGYRSSTIEHCPNAVVVWDRFHLMRNFENALNDERLEIIDRDKSNKSLKAKAGGRFKYIFLKRARYRGLSEKRSLNEVMKLNKDFYKLELIKEKFFLFFIQKSADDAQELLVELKRWITKNKFRHLGKWCENFIGGWETIKNYFTYRVTSALSEGQNNVIKAIKRRCFGFRNMTYFKLKILQVCGYLNSRYISIDNY